VQDEATPSGQYKTCTYQVCSLLARPPHLFLTLSFAPGVGMVVLKDGMWWLLSSFVLAEHEPNWPLQPPDPNFWK